MKMVKSLLLGSAAGLVAVSAGQAADLPVKAKPVEYVKVCSLYGAGFYYMPGTDICLKIGGYARAETTYHSNGNMTAGPTSTWLNERQTSEFVARARAYVTADAREQTAWGTARAYVAVGVATTDVGSTVVPSILGFNRAFVQWAGITAGITQSFFDFYSSAAVGYRAYLPSEDTGDSGWWLWAYTAQLGNGVAATISAEQRRTTQIAGFLDGATVPNLNSPFSNGSLVGGGGPPATLNSTLTTPGYGGWQVPDIVGNIRVDQTWGSAQVMGVAHEVNAQYYFPDPANPTGGNLIAAGHPGDEWGWVAAAGLRWNFPYFAQGDYFQTEVNYTQGALRYLSMGNNGANWSIERGNTFGYGLMSDCVFGSTNVGTGTNPVIANGTGCQLTTGWSINASYEHYWTPQFHESFVGQYMAVRYDTTANNNLCQFEAVAVGAVSGSQAPAVAGCDNNWSEWAAATRFQYDFTKSLYIGVEFLYLHLDTAKQANNVLTATNIVAVGPAGNGLVPGATLKDQDALAVTLRIHKDFLP
jgi:hypothetical protein